MYPVLSSYNRFVVTPLFKRMIAVFLAFFPVVSIGSLHLHTVTVVVHFLSEGVAPGRWGLWQDARDKRLKLKEHSHQSTGVLH